MTISRVNENPDLIRCSVSDSFPIAKGDAIWRDNGDGFYKPASEYTWDTDLATTQGNFAADFVGIAVETNVVPVYSDRPITEILVDKSASAHWDVDLSSAVTVTADEYFALAEGSSDLSNTVWVKAASTVAIARPQREYAAATSVARVQMMSAKSAGSGNVNANVG